MQMRRLGLALVIAICACGDDGGGGGGTPDARQPDAYVPDADFGDVPRVEAAACRFVVAGSLALTEGTDYSCGDLVVEENRGTHTGRIRLHFIRIKSSVSSPNATIYLDGGPGGDGQGILDYAAYLGSGFLNGLLVDGDFLVIGQRGTRLSLPFLSCGSVGSCSQLNADLTAYNSAYNADDVNDLRATLGITKLNLYGISYGSRLGLEIMRRHGDHVRASVIEGLVPSSVHWPAAIPASFYSALTSLNTSCANAGSCGTTFGNLVTKFTGAVDTLNANPVTITGSSGTETIDGYTFAYLVFRMMYSKSSYSWLPLIINDLATRRTDRVGSYVSQWIDNLSSSDIARGLYYGVVCGELYNPPDPSAPTNANSGVPAEFIDLFGGSYYSLEETCADWPKHDLATTMKQPVTSSVRTLVSSGRLDPITPPNFGDVAAATLASSVKVVHENSGHGATLQSTCGQQNLQAFLANPDATPNTSCAASITTTYNIPGMFAAPPVSWKQIRAELAIAPMPPFLRDRLR